MYNVSLDMNPNVCNHRVANDVHPLQTYEYIYLLVSFSDLLDTFSPSYVEYCMKRPVLYQNGFLKSLLSTDHITRMRDHKDVADMSSPIEHVNLP